MTPLDLTPGPPAWRVDWNAIANEFEWIADMKGVPQDPIHHAEGDVFTHVGMVLEELAALPAFRALSEPDRRTVFAAAMLHDVAKPACTRRDGDRITSHGHSAKGAIRARRILWELDIPFAERERICGLVRHHQVAMQGIDREGLERTAFRVSLAAPIDLLCVLTEADARGRICADPARLLDNIALFGEYCREKECFAGPRRFPSDHSRFLYFRLDGRDPEYLAHDDTRLTVTLLSGLPGSGKDHWIESSGPGWPVVSLDAIRRSRGISPAGDQGEVVAAARDLAKEHLRSGRSFIWNATHLSAELREQSIGLCARYGARVEIVYVESPADALMKQNRGREHAVPDAAVERMLGRWEVPTAVEAHAVSVVLR